MERSTDIWRFNTNKMERGLHTATQYRTLHRRTTRSSGSLQPTKGPLQLFSMEEVHKQLGELGLKLKCWRHPAIQINYSCSNWTISN